MRQQGKTRSTSADDEPVIQLTRGQMVVAVCGLLVGALIFYLLGVLTSHIEPRFTDEQAQQQIAHVLPAPDEPGPATPARNNRQKTASAPEGVQASPRTDLLPAKQKDKPANPTQTATNDDGPPLSRVPAPAEGPDTSDATAQETIKTTIPVDPNTLAKSPRRVELSPKNETEKQADSDPGKPQKAPEPAKTAPEGSDATPPPAPAVSADKPQTATDAAEQAKKDTGADLEKIELPPETVSAGSPPKDAGKPFYSIQLIAFSKANRAKAEAYAKEVRETAGLDVEIDDSSKGEYVRVFVGRYADRESALRACQELKKQERFSKVFVPESPRGN